MKERKGRTIWVWHWVVKLGLEQLLEKLCMIKASWLAVNYMELLMKQNKETNKKTLPEV